MAKNKRPKYLDKETPELLAMLNEILTSEDPDTDKAAKIAAELKDRMAEAPVTNVDEALQTAADQMTKALNMVKAAYDAEVAMIGSEDEEEDEGEDEPEEKPSKKTGKKKASKKAAADEDEDEDDEEDEDEDDEEDDEPDYDSMSQKALKAELRKRGIRVKKEMGKADMVKALKADDAE